MANKKNSLGDDFKVASVKPAVPAMSKKNNLHLEQAFKSAAGKGSDKALTAFNRATERLLKEEAKFKSRPRWEKLSLTHYLRSHDHHAALETFAEAKEALLSINPQAAKQLILEAEKALIRAVTPSKPVSASQFSR